MKCKSGVTFFCITALALACGTPYALAQDAPMLPPAVKAALDAWVACSASAATRYATQPGDVGDLADAALGACEDQFSQYTAAMQKDDAARAQAAGDDARFIAEVTAHDAAAARRNRSDLRARLMSLILDTRAKAKN